MAITYTKLQSGGWGIRSTVALTAGQAVTVEKRDGSTKTETVERVVWTGNDVWIAAIRATARPAAPATARRDRGHGMVRGCAQCTAAGRMCRQCAFDEYD